MTSVVSNCIICCKDYKSEITYGEDNEGNVPPLPEKLKLFQPMWTTFCQNLSLSPSEWEDILDLYLQVNSIPFCECCWDICTQFFNLQQQLQSIQSQISKLKKTTTTTIIQTLIHPSNQNPVVSNDKENAETSQLAQRVSALRQHLYDQYFSPVAILPDCGKSSETKGQENDDDGEETPPSQPKKNRSLGQLFSLTKIFKCRFCPETYSRLAQLKEHMQQVCGYCHTSFNCDTLRHRHVQAVHRNRTRVRPPSRENPQECSTNIQQYSPPLLVQQQEIIFLDDDDVKPNINEEADNLINNIKEEPVAPVSMDSTNDDYELCNIDQNTFGFGGFCFQKLGCEYHCLKCGSSDKSIETMKLHIKSQHVDKSQDEVDLNPDTMSEYSFKMGPAGFECCACRQIFPIMTQVIGHIQNSHKIKSPPLQQQSGNLMTEAESSTLEMQIQQEIMAIKTESGDPNSTKEMYDVPMELEDDYLDGNLQNGQDFDPLSKDPLFHKLNLKKLNPRTKVLEFQDCPLCPQLVFQDPMELCQHFRAHQKLNESVGDKSCFLCQKLVSQSSLARHFKAHSSDRRHRCHLCVKKFVEADKLKAHLATAHSTKQ